MSVLKLELNNHTVFVDMPEKFRDLEAGMLHIENALRTILENAGMIQTYDERLKELGHRTNGMTKNMVHKPRLWDEPATMMESIKKGR